MKSIKLNRKDRHRLAELYRWAQTTPVIAFNLEAACRGEDQATLAWNNVRKFMDELGKEYGFDPATSSINSNTGEVQDLEDIVHLNGRRFQLNPKSKNERKS